MNNVLIHIGYHKTASTWLQRKIFTSESNVFVPLSRSDHGQSSLARRFVYSNDGYLLNSFDDNESGIKEELHEILSNKECEGQKMWVVSHERLSGNPHSSGFDASIIALRIKKIFHQAKIMIVIREQTSWLLSNYFQYLSIGGTHSLKKYLNTPYDGKRPGFSPGHIAYHHLIERYYTLFGRENVLVLPYEIFNSDKQLFFGMLGDFVGRKISLNTEDFNQQYGTRRNHSVNYKLRRLNAFIHSASVNDFSRQNYRLGRQLALGILKLSRRCSSKKSDELMISRLVLELEEWSKDRFCESNSITQGLTGINLEQLGYKM